MIVFAGIITIALGRLRNEEKQATGRVERALGERVDPFPRSRAAAPWPSWKLLMKLSWSRTAMH